MSLPMAEHRRRRQSLPSGPPGCFVMDTIAHSTMGDLVVGNYDLNPGHGVSGNAFIYNMTTHQWTLLQLGGSLSSLTTSTASGRTAAPEPQLHAGRRLRGARLLPTRNQRAFL